VIAVTRSVDLATAEKLKGRFVELLIAPRLRPGRPGIPAEKSTGHPPPGHRPLVSRFQPQGLQAYPGGMLVQDRDVELNRKWDPPPRRSLPESLKGLALFTWKACKHVKSMPS